MAKLSFTKLGLKPNNQVTNINFNDQVIEVKHYISTEEKIKIVANVLELSHDENNFSNPIKIKVYTALEIIDKYTNITFTDKQKETVLKIYDLINGNGLVKLIFDTIPQEELNNLLNTIDETVTSVYAFQNSVLGILEAVSNDYSALNLNASEIQSKLADPNNMAFLKQVMDRLG